MAGRERGKGEREGEKVREMERKRKIRRESERERERDRKKERERDRACVTERNKGGGEALEKVDTTPLILFQLSRLTHPAPLIIIIIITNIHV